MQISPNDIKMTFNPMTCTIHQKSLGQPSSQSKLCKFLLNGHMGHYFKTKNETWFLRS
jgi:hypothetical protein